MSDFYLRMQATATRLIDQYGAVVIIKQVISAPNANKEWLDDHTSEVSKSVKMVFISGSTAEYFKQLIPKTEMLEEGEKVIFPIIDGLTPNQGDLIYRGDELYEIKKVKAVQPADVALLYFAVLI